MATKKITQTAGDEASKNIKPTSMPKAAQYLALTGTTLCACHWCRVVPYRG
ncbi:putative orphan protein [Pseudoalteromonas translucida]|uniref:Orphan protein n=1 Tax=Pseudoalteromonas translucida (strain TAC 125) TaxID=326442 RepID=Q3IK14_PSET1|nr:putative orphan protein [Pseudoalteromonas translucida]